MEGLLYIAGAGIYAARVPERFAPGRFDLLGASHQVFHCLVVAAAGSHLVGLVKVRSLFFFSLFFFSPSPFLFILFGQVNKAGCFVMLMRFSHGASRGSIICMVEMRKYVVRIIPYGILREKEERKKTQGWREIYFFLGRLSCYCSAVFR